MAKKQDQTDAEALEGADAAVAEDETQYIVMSGGYGMWQQGSILGVKDIYGGPEDIPNLLAMGALQVYAPEPEPEAVEEGAEAGEAGTGDGSPVEGDTTGDTAPLGEVAPEGAPAADGAPDPAPEDPTPAPATEQ